MNCSRCGRTMLGFEEHIYLCFDCMEFTIYGTKDMDQVGGMHKNEFDQWSLQRKSDPDVDWLEMGSPISEKLTEAYERWLAELILRK